MRLDCSVVCRLSTEEFSHYAALTHCVGRGASCSFGEDDHCCRGDGDGDGDGDEDEVGDGDHGDVYFTRHFFAPKSRLSRVLP